MRLNMEKFLSVGVFQASHSISIIRETGCLRIGKWL